MDYRIELRDSDFNLLAFLENEARNISWAYERLGGCGGFSFKLPRKFDDIGAISGEFNIRIYKRTGAGTHTLWYQGLIEDRTPYLEEEEKVEVRGFGYVTQLNRVLVNETYTSDEISVIVKDILDTYVTPNTDISYDAGDVVDTGFTPDSLEFKNVTAMSAIKTLADLAGTREWGVGNDRKFFFKARSDTLSHHWYIGSDISKVRQLDAFKDIINRVVIEGGDVGGSKYTRTVNDEASQLKYKLRTKVISNAAIVSNTVADQYGAKIIDENKDVRRRVTCTRIGDETLVETTIPLALASIRERGVFYGEKSYGTFLYSGIIKYRINRITYKLDENGGVIKTFELGDLVPKNAENIKRLEFEIDQLRAARE